MTEVSPLLWSNLKDISAPNEETLKRVMPNEEPTKQEFLRLFMAQLKNQDPLSPMDQQDMTAQLATFTSLEKQIESNKTLGDIRDSLRGQESWQAASWVGKNIRIDATSLAYDGGDMALHYRLPEGVANSQVKVIDESGALVRSFAATEQGENAHAPGEHALGWDGKKPPRPADACRHLSRRGRGLRPSGPPARRRHHAARRPPRWRRARGRTGAPQGCRPAGSPTGCSRSSLSLFFACRQKTRGTPQELDP